MRKLVALLIIAAITTAVVKADVRNISKRMDGINAGLVGIVSDEYTDIFSVNSSRLLDVEGYRLYSNLSNLVNGIVTGNAGTETPLSGGTSSNEFLIGGIMPFPKPLEGIGNIGALISKIDNKDTELVQYAAFGAAGYDATASAGNAIVAAPINAAVTAGELNWQNINTATLGTTITTQEIATAHDNIDEIDANLLAGINVLNFADLGIRVRYNTIPDPNGAAPTNLNAEYAYSYSHTNSANALDAVSYSYTATNKGTAGNAAASTLPTFNMNTIAIAPSARKEIAGIDLGVSAEIELAKGEQRADASTSLLVQPACSDAAFLAAHAGIPALTAAYQRTWTAAQALEVNGTGISGRVDVAYPLSDRCDVKAIIGYAMSPLSGSGDSTWVDYIIQDGVGGLAQRQTVTDELSYDETNNVIDTRLGLEKQVSDSLLLGLGIGLNLTAIEMIFEDSSNQALNEGGATPGRIYLANSKFTSDWKTTTISIPVGLEWKATKWLKARMGATYTRTSRDITNTLENETVNATTGLRTALTTRITEGTTVPRTGATTYVSGVGLMLSKNLTVDVTNVAATSILNPVAWQLGATLLF